MKRICERLRLVDVMNPTRRPDRDEYPLEPERGDPYRGPLQTTHVPSPAAPVKRPGWIAGLVVAYLAMTAGSDAPTPRTTETLVFGLGVGVVFLLP